MLQKTWKYCVLMGGLLLSPGVLRAQEPVPPPPPPAILHIEGADAGYMVGERIELLGFEAGGTSRVVKGAPFSAVAVTETAQTLVDGNHIHRTTQTTLYRDSEGRTRREITLPAIGPFTASGKTHTFTSIYDPVAGANYMLEPDEKIARKLPLLPPEMLGRTTAKFVGAGPTQGPEDVQTESMGAQTINGVSAEGTSYTRTIPAGTIGNDKPIVIVSERWYSPELQVVVMSKRSDPRFGQTTYELTNIEREEPAPSLFQVPSDYTVKDGAPGRDVRVSRSPVSPPPDP